MWRDLAGRRIVLTGASSGIGRALAIELARAGARLVLAARREDRLRALADELGRPEGDVVLAPTDLTVPEQRARLLDTAREQLGGLDVLINNAGIGSWAHFQDSTEGLLR